MSVIRQLVIQIQKGCRHHCYRTTQVQTATQVATAIQRAAATAVSSQGDAVNRATAARSGSAPLSQLNTSQATAAATNETRIVQYILQWQWGCLHHCYLTSLVQQAVQVAIADQQATASAVSTQTAANLAVHGGPGGEADQANRSSASATTANSAAFEQHVFQAQTRCRRRCHGAKHRQSVIQTTAAAQAGVQAATADQTTANQQVSDPFSIFGGPTTLFSQQNLAAVEAWAAANNLTLQVTRQKLGGCRRHCHGDRQVQEASLDAASDQTTSADAKSRPKQSNSRGAVKAPTARLTGPGLSAADVALTTTTATNAATTQQSVERTRLRDDDRKRKKRKKRKRKKPRRD